MSRFTKRNDWIERRFTPAELVASAVYCAGFDIDDQVEKTKAEVEKLTEIVGLLAAQLPEQQLVEFAYALGFDPVKKAQK